MRTRRRADNSQLRFYLPLALLVLGGFLLALRFVEPAPPRTVRIAAGEPGGAYDAFARRYAELMSREGIALEVVPTHGSVENLARLQRGEVEIAFVQGGVAPQSSDGPALQGLGSLFYEPLWLFLRSELERPGRLPALESLRINLGPEGSGTRALVIRLLRDNGLDPASPGFLALDSSEAERALADGRIDGAFFVASAQSERIGRLLHHPEIRPVSFERAAAYARRYAWLRELVVPEGSEDLAANLPRQDLRLLATTAALVVREDLHPAIVNLLMQVLEKVHGQGDRFEPARRFPTPDFLAFPLNEEAERYYRHGPPFLQRYLPFWAASFIDRMKIMLLPLLGLLLPLFKVAPPLYRWRMRARIYRWYDELEAVDLEAPEARDPERLLQVLDDLEKEVREVKVPLAFSDQLYHLRQHIDFVRQEVRRRAGGREEAHSSKPGSTQSGRGQ